MFSISKRVGEVTDELRLAAAGAGDSLRDALAPVLFVAVAALVAALAALAMSLSR